jgi:hypothetical protein
LWPEEDGGVGLVPFSAARVGTRGK